MYLAQTNRQSTTNGHVRTPITATRGARVSIAAIAAATKAAAPVGLPVTEGVHCAEGVRHPSGGRRTFGTVRAVVRHGKDSLAQPPLNWLLVVMVAFCLSLAVILLPSGHLLHIRTLCTFRP